MNPLLEPLENPQDSPQSPPRLRLVDVNGGSDGKEISPSDDGPSFQDFARNYPIPILHHAECLTIWSVLDVEERRAAVRGAAVYAKFISAYDRRPVDARRFLRERMWEGLKQEADSVPSSRMLVPVAEDAGRAWLNVCITAFGSPGDPPEPPYHWRASGGAISVLSEWPPGGQGWLVPRAEWLFVEHGTKQFHAYAERMREMFQREPLVQRAVLGDRRHRLISTDGAAWGKREFRGLLVPSEWPPPKGTAGAAGSELSADEINAFIGT